MKWLWKRRDPEASRARERAEAELKRARCDLAKTRAQEPEVRELAESLRDLRERNHFGETIAAIYRGERP